MRGYRPFLHACLVIGCLTIVVLLLFSLKRPVAGQTGADLYLPYAAKPDQTTEQEPNNVYESANGPVRSGITYTGYHNDVSDYYKFHVDLPGAITVKLNSKYAQAVNSRQLQLQIYYQSAVVENRVGLDTTAPYLVDFTGNPGWYYIRVTTDNCCLNASQSYEIVATYPYIEPTATPTSPPTATPTPTNTATATNTPTTVACTLTLTVQSGPNPPQPNTVMRLEAPDTLGLTDALVQSYLWTVKAPSASAPSPIEPAPTTWRSASYGLWEAGLYVFAVLITKSDGNRYDCRNQVEAFPPPTPTPTTGAMPATPTPTATTDGQLLLALQEDFSGPIDPTKWDAHELQHAEVKNGVLAFDTPLNSSNEWASYLLDTQLPGTSDLRKVKFTVQLDSQPSAQTGWLGAFVSCGTGSAWLSVYVGGAEGRLTVESTSAGADGGTSYGFQRLDDQRPHVIELLLNNGTATIIIDGQTQTTLVPYSGAPCWANFEAALAPNTRVKGHIDDIAIWTNPTPNSMALTPFYEPKAWMLNDIDVNRFTFDPSYTTNCARNSSCYRIAWQPEQGKWIGLWWIYKDADGGTWPQIGQPGCRLTQAYMLTFWARGERGGEVVEFATAFYANQSSPFAPITLTTTWTQYTIDLSNAKLAHVVGGFAWIFAEADNGLQNTTFYLDDIRFHGINQANVQCRQTPPNWVGYSFDQSSEQWTTSEGAFKLAQLSTTTDVVHSGKQALRLMTELDAQKGKTQAVYNHTEATAYFNTAIPQGIAQAGPYNLTGKKVLCYVYAPSALANSKVYLRLFAKDAQFRNHYGDRVELTTSRVDRWLYLELTVGQGSGQDAQFNAAQTNTLGVRIELGSDSTLKFTGPLYIDTCWISYP